MRHRGLLLAGVASFVAGPALALDPTAEVPADRRLRVVQYNPEEVALVYTKPGQTTRIRLDPHERVVKGGVVYSDQTTMAALDGTDPYTEEDRKADQQGAAGTGSSGDGEQSCNRNMCISVVLNTVYIMPRVQLQPQSFFLRTEWCPEPGKACEPGEYAIELRTAPPAASTGVAEPFFGIQYDYGAREMIWRSRQAAIKRAADMAAAAQARRNNPQPQPLPVSIATDEDRWDLGVCSSAPEIHPDEAWTDGRSTFLRYNGTRPVPNVYQRRTDKVETLTAYTVEPDASGNVIRIADVRPILILRSTLR